MSFVDCINTAVADGRLSQNRGQKATQAYNAAVANAIANGATPTAAANGASFAAIDALSKSTMAQKWARINQMRALHRIHGELSVTKDPVEYLKRFMEDLSDRIKYLRGDLFAPLNNFIAKYEPKGAGLWRPIEDMDEIVRASFGATNVTGEVSAMSKALADFFEYVRTRANAAGASIPVNPNYRLPQNHAWEKLRAAGPDIVSAKANWVNDQIRTLDWTVIQYQGKLVPAQDRVRVLGETFDAIIADGHVRQNPGVPENASMTSRLNQERFLYYKDADAYLEMQKKYGTGNIFEMVIGMSEARAHDIALMEIMGPNPLNTKSYIRRLAENRARELEVVRDGSGRRITSKVESELATFDAQYEINSMSVLNAGEAFWPQGVKTTKTFALTGLLAKVFVASQADHFTSRYAATRFGLPGMNLTTEYLKQFAYETTGLVGRQDKLDLMASGVVSESSISQAHIIQRYFGSTDGAKFMQRYSDISFRLGLATPHTQAARSAWQKELMRVWGKHAGMAWDDVPFQPALREFGITKADWDLFRATPQFTPGSTPMFSNIPPMWLRPMDLWRSTAGNQAQNRAVANKFGDLMAYTLKVAVPEAGSRTQAALGLHTPADTVFGQIVRSVGALKSFPMLMYHTYYRDLQRARLPTTDKFALGARFMVYMLGAGVFVTQLQNLVNGNTPYNPGEAEGAGHLDFLSRTVLNAGILGPLGDILATGLDSGQGKGRSLAEAVAGPLPAFLGDTGEVTGGNLFQLAQGKDANVTAETTRWLSRYVPNYWYMKVIMEREFYDELLRNNDPAAYSRKKRNLQKRNDELGREQWWPMS